MVRGRRPPPTGEPVGRACERHRPSRGSGSEAYEISPGIRVVDALTGVADNAQVLLASVRVDDPHIRKPGVQDLLGKLRFGSTEGARNQNGFCSVQRSADCRVYPLERLGPGLQPPARQKRN